MCTTHEAQLQATLVLLIGGTLCSNASGLGLRVVLAAVLPAAAACRACDMNYRWMPPSADT